MALLDRSLPFGLAAAQRHPLGISDARRALTKVGVE
jgi:hypothetical protein